MSQLPSSDFLIAAGVLLILAFVLLLYARRRQRVVIERSIATDELAIHLARIADALDRIAIDNSERVRAEAAERDRKKELADPPTPSLNQASGQIDQHEHSMPYSIFER